MSTIKQSDVPDTIIQSLVDVHVDILDCPYCEIPHYVTRLNPIEECPHCGEVWFLTDSTDPEGQIVSLR